MSILSQLSSQCDDRTEQSNVKVTFLCLEEPRLLEDIRKGLLSDDDLLAGDCAEVMTKVAEERPEIIVPYTDALLSGLDRKKARVRWESMHALALIADRIPDKIGPVLRHIDRLIHTDKSVIVQHCGILALGKYASSGRHAAMNAYDFLKRAVFAHDGKFAHHAMDGLIYVVKLTGEYDADISRMALSFLNHKRISQKKAAEKLIRAIDRKGR